MRAWWWVLITAQLVWGNPEQIKDDYGNSINVETDENSVTEDQVHPSSILNAKAFYARIRRRYEEDERKKKLLRFHSWGGKRDGDEEEEGLRDNSDTEESLVIHEPGDEDLLTEISSNLSSNASSLETDDFGKYFRETFIKRRESSPAFYPWGGKRDPEILNDVGLSKRSNYYGSILQQNSLGSRPEQSRKRYPSFSSWAGKRASASRSWGGKEDYSVENEDNFEVKKEYSKATKGFYDDTYNQVDLNNGHNPVHNTLNPNSLGSEYKLNVQEHDHDTNSDRGHSIKVTPKENEHYLSEERNVQAEFGNLPITKTTTFSELGGKGILEENTALVKIPYFNSWAEKRALAFNSWGGKRAPAFNSWGGKRTAAFNSWGGKRAPAFNSWGGKRAHAFNSWGGKRVPAFNSWGGKRVAAFNSWGGKRIPAFNSWGGKRAAGFNIRGEKKPPAFNSWGGKRFAAFNSWGGKRAAGFNSWGGKREVDEYNEKPNFEYPFRNNNRELHGVYFPLISRQDNKFIVKTKEFLHTNDKTNPIQDYTYGHDNNLGKIPKNNFYLVVDERFMNLDSDNLKNHEKNNNRETYELTGQSSRLEKRARSSFTGWSGKRSPIFSSWYGGKIPTMLLTNGKRKPAFSSWGGKRSGGHNTIAEVDYSLANAGTEDAAGQKHEEEANSQQPSLPDEKTYTRKKREVEYTQDKNNSALAIIKRDKRASGNFLKNRVFTRMMMQGGWPMTFQSRTHGKDFFAWGGKRSSDTNTSR